MVKAESSKGGEATPNGWTKNELGIGKEKRKILILFRKLFESQDLKEEKVDKGKEAAVMETWGKIQKMILIKYEIIKELTDNSDVKGKYIESIIRSMIKNWVKPYEMSNGLIVLKGLDDQIDGIIWERHRAPAIVEEGEFVAVLPDAVRAVIEIKSTGNKFQIKNLQTKLKRIKESVSGYTGISVEPYSLITCGIVIWSEIDTDEMIDDYSNDEDVPIFILCRRKDREFYINEGILWKIIKFIYGILPTGGVWRVSFESNKS